MDESSSEQGMKNIVILNFKCYKEATGESALELARLAAEVAMEWEVRLIVAPRMVDLPLFKAEFANLEYFAQHCDPQEDGPYTGRITLSDLQRTGARGVLVNHSEYPQTPAEISTILKNAHSYGLETCLCVPDERALETLEWRAAEMVAVEPPELIGGNDSVSKTKPDLLMRAYSKINQINPKCQKLCGAGIRTSEDVVAARQLGADGVLISSGFVFAKDHRAVLRGLFARL